MPEPTKGEADKSAPTEKEETETALPQTQEELDAFVEAAFEAREKERLKRKKPKPKREETDDEEDEEDAAELIRNAELKAATAQQRADEAERRALLGEIKGKVHDYLALNAREFSNNAIDIMAHIEKAIPLGHMPKEGEIARLVESHSKAFIERTKAARKPASGAPVGGARRTAGIGGADDPEQRRTVDRVVAAKADAITVRPFAHLNWQ